jgi:hypothetical protein
MKPETVGSVLQSAGCRFLKKISGRPEKRDRHELHHSPIDFGIADHVCRHTAGIPGHVSQCDSSCCTSGEQEIAVVKPWCLAADIQETDYRILAAPNRYQDRLAHALRIRRSNRLSYSEMARINTVWRFPLLNCPV